MQRLLWVSASALVLGFGVAACVTPQRRAEDVREKCDIQAGETEIATPRNAQAYLDAIEPQHAHLLRRGWPFETHWFRNEAEHTTVLCNVAPAYNADRHGDHCINNQFGAIYNDTPSGPVKIEDIVVICVD